MGTEEIKARTEMCIAYWKRATQFQSNSLFAAATMLGVRDSIKYIIISAVAKNCRIRNIFYNFNETAFPA